MLDELIIYTCNPIMKTKKGDQSKFEISLVYIVILRPARVTYRECWVWGSTNIGGQTTEIYETRSKLYSKNHHGAHKAYQLTGITARVWASETVAVGEGSGPIL